MFSNKKLAVAVSGAVLLMAGQFALADSTTDIVDALVSKGVLTEEEGKLISKGHETKKKADGTVSFKDGFKLNSGDGKADFAITGRIQADYRWFDTPESTSLSNAEGGNADTFDIRRAYLTAKGKYRNTSFDATLDKGTLKYYWLEYAVAESFKIRFGQYKTPMGFETNTSSRWGDFTERDFTSYLQASINKGIMIHGVPSTGLTYAVMASNGGLVYEEGSGTTIETNNNADGKSVTGRLTANFAEIMGNKDNILHVGVSAGYDSNLPTKSAGITLGTNAKGTTFFSSGSIANPDVRRLGFEAVAAFGPVKVQSEFNSMDIDSSSAISKELTAYYIGASYMLTGENYSGAYKNGLMDRMTPKNSYTGLGSSGWGAWEIGARYSNFDGSDFASTIVNGFTTGANSYTVGVKWIADPNTRFLFNYIKTDFDTPVSQGLTVLPATATSEKAFNFRAQFDF